MQFTVGSKTTLKLVACFSSIVLLLLIVDTQFQVAGRLPRPLLANVAALREAAMVINTGNSTSTVHNAGANAYGPGFAKCKPFKGTGSKPEAWPEDAALKEPTLKNATDAVSPSNSKLRALFNVTDVRLGNQLDVEVVLHDGLKRRLVRGGDQVLVIMRDPKRGAGVTGKVTDNHNGSYLAQLPVWWVGDLEIKALITAPRQLVETALRRRFVCPQLYYDEIEYRHPTNPSIKREFSTCNSDPDIPGHDVICNMTSQNYGSAWFCGAPRNKQLACSDWSIIRAKWPRDITMTPGETTLLNTFEKAQYLPGRIKVVVKKDANSSTTVAVNPTAMCHEIGPAQTWNRTAPIGFFYGHRWINTLCQAPSNLTYLRTCLKNTKVMMIGDSTLRQWRDILQEIMSCEAVTDSFSGGEVKFHRPTTAYNSALNFTVTWGPHGLPFTTPHTPHWCFKSFKAYLDEVNVSSRLIIILHAFAHYTPIHSSMFTRVIRDTVTAIEQLLARSPKVIIAIKGPHSFLNKGKRVLAYIEKYADIYQEIIQREFSHLSDKVFFLDFLDMTRAVETKAIHAADNVNTEAVNQFFGQICKP